MKKTVQTYVVDTSVVIEKIISNLIKQKKFEGTLIIPNAVIAELESQANKGREIGFIGLEEIQEIRGLITNNKNVTLEFYGNRPSETQIKFAKSGEIDAYIRQIAYDHKATLFTADLVQAESGKAYGLNVQYIPPKKLEEHLSIEKLFDQHTMSIHLKQDCIPMAKRGKPGNWRLEPAADKPYTGEELQEIAKEIVEKTRLDSTSFVEIARKGSTIVQYKNIRIVIVRPPVSDGLEITAVRPMIKLTLKDYNLDKKVFDRIATKARGILIVGETGSGKSCFTQALGEHYAEQGNIVKTIESPRDLELTDKITQYSKNFTSSEEIHDILFLSRPDKIIFDEVRDTPDFELYTDLRLAAPVLGVVHAITPIDAIQRFIPRLDIGMIPSILDTIIFLDKGSVAKIYTLNMIVKVPEGMTESDLARPIVEVKDFINNTPVYEIYSYGEQTVVIPVGETNKQQHGAYALAAQSIKHYFTKYVRDPQHIHVEIVSNNRAIVSVPDDCIAKIIGSGGKNIEHIEHQLGISIEVQEFTRDKKSIPFEVNEDAKYVKLYAEPGTTVDIHVDGKFLFSAITSKNGEINVHKKSQLGRDLLRALSHNKAIELKA